MQNHIATRHAATRLPALFTAALLLAVIFAACTSKPNPSIEQFPDFLPGVWEEVGGPVGTLTFEGTTSSGVGRLSADGIAAQSFTWQWVAPAIIRTSLNDDTEFTVLFEDGGDTLVLATVAAAEMDEVLRYRRREQ